MSERQRWTMHPICVADRISIVYVDRGELVRQGHVLVSATADGALTIPVGRTSVVMLGPGVSVSHAAVALCAAEGALLLWVGEMGVRLYAAGNPGGRSEALLRQARLAQADEARLLAAGRIFFHMFGEPAPKRRSIEQLRGIEGARVRAIYARLAEESGIEWVGRDTTSVARPIDAALAGVNAALYGLCEAVILALGYSPALGFIHSGDARSFVFDVADMVKFQTVVPLAFRLAAERPASMEHRARTAARDLFFEQSLAAKLVDLVEDVLRADHPA
jgi:CRISPR-associated protein Cas1